MECSKLFSGDLPEITSHIINYLRNDFKSLYSCLLVNRFFCQVTMPILWENPFSVIRRERCSYNFLDTYLFFLNEDEKTKLKEYGININSPSFKNPLFNYPSFIKSFNLFRVELHIVNWINNLNSLSDTNNQLNRYTNQKIYKLTFPPLF